MKVTYNPTEDTLHILFCSAPIHESENHRAGLILDYDQHGRIVGLELASASEHMSHPHIVDFVEDRPATAPPGECAAGEKESGKTV